MTDGVAAEERWTLSPSVMSRESPPLYFLPEGSGVSLVPDGGNSRESESVVKHLVAGYFLASSPLFRWACLGFGSSE